MDKQKFLSAIEGNFDIEDVIQMFASPPGRHPNKTWLMVAEWRHHLTSDEKNLFNEVVAKSIRATIFELLTIIDGVRIIDKKIAKFLIAIQDYQGQTILIDDDKDTGYYSRLTSGFNWHSNLAVDDEGIDCMDEERFMSLVEKHVRDYSVDNLIWTFTSPSDQHQEEILGRIAKWRRNLANGEKKLFDKVVAESVRIALFDFFVVIDGSRVVDKNINRFIIIAQDCQGQRKVLNEDNSRDWHDYFTPDPE